MRLFAPLIFLSILFFLVPVTARPTEPAQHNRTVTFWTDMPHQELAAEITRQMTDEELLAQILMFGWAGSAPSSLVTAWVSNRSLGSIKIFGWNTDNLHQVSQAITTLQQKAQENRFQIPLFVATDQEGGWIRHIKGSTSDTPGNLAIGASGLPIDAYYTGYYIAQQLRALGINMNFAPTVDLYTSHDSTVITTRSFGENPTAAGILGAAFSSGSMAQGVLTTAKHFPGHGDTGTDSHGILPIIDIDKETLLNRELIPFKYLIAEGIPAIMSGHLNFPNITKNNEPASLSYTFLTEILRNQMGFTGLIITDDMMMNGATIYAGSFSAAVRMAIEAGNDIIISSTTPGLQDAVWRNNVQLMKSDSAFRATVATSAERVLLSKLTYLKKPDAVPLFPSVADIKTYIPTAEADSFFLEQACRSITLYQNQNNAFPFLPTDTTTRTERILIASPFSAFNTEGKKRYPHADTVSFPYMPGRLEAQKAREALQRSAKQYDTIIFCLASAEGLSILKGLENSGKKIIVISAMSPVYMLDVHFPDIIIASYSYSPYSFTAAFAALAGDFYPRGVLPLKTDTP